MMEKLQQLPPEKVTEVEDFIDFLYERHTDRWLTMAAAKLSEPLLQRVWDNPADAEYDNL